MGSRDYLDFANRFFDIDDAAKERANGWSNDKTRMDPSWSFEDTTQLLYLQADEVILTTEKTMLEQHRKEGVPLDSWIVVVTYRYDQGRVWQLANAWPRTRVLEVLASRESAPYREAYAQLRRPVPANEFPVVILVPFGRQIRIWNRPLGWRAPLGANGEPLFVASLPREEARIVAPDTALIDFLRAAREGSRAERETEPAPPLPTPPEPPQEEAAPPPQEATPSDTEPSQEG